MAHALSVDLRRRTASDAHDMPVQAVLAPTVPQKLPSATVAKAATVAMAQAPAKVTTQARL